jgi:hypothetical protein
MPFPPLRRLAAAAALAVVMAAAPSLPAYADDTTGTVAGHLLDGTTPVSDATVTLIAPDNSSELATAAVDAEGAFSLTDVAPGNYLVRFDLPGGVKQYYPAASEYYNGQEVTVTAGEQSAVEAALFAHASVTGRVLTADGAPLADATVYLQPTQTYMNWPPTLTTDANGDFTAPYVWPDSYRVLFRDNVTHLLQFVPRKITADDAQTFAFEAGQAQVINETQLPLGTITGTVLRAGVPAKGGVNAYQAPSGGAMTFTSLAADGSFSLRTFAVPTQLQFKVQSGTSGVTQWYPMQTTRAGAEVLDVPAGGTLTINESIVDPLSTGIMTGVLTDATGAALPNIPVVITSAGGKTYQTTTDGAGKYKLVLPTGSYRVRFDGPGFTQWAYGQYSEDRAAWITISGGRTTGVNDTLQPKPPVLGITGRLTDNGQPVPDAIVTIYDTDYNSITSGYTSYEGDFSFPDVPPGTYKVRFTLMAGWVTQWAHQAWDFESAQTYTVAEGQGVEIAEELAPHGQISGHLTAADGSPVSGPYVTATSVDGRIRVGTNGDADGGYTLPFVPAGDYLVSFQPYGPDGPAQYAYQKTRAEDADVITVAANTSVTVDDQALPVAFVSGHLTNHGQPVPDAQIYFNNVDGTTMYGSTDSDGAFRTALTPGQYKVYFALSSGLVQWAHGATDESDATLFTFGVGETTLDEELLPTGTLRGHLTDQQGAPVTSGTVEISSGTNFFNAYLDENGGWSVSVPPGNYRVRFVTDTASQWAYGKTNAKDANLIAVTADQTTVVDDALLPTGALTVTATDATSGKAIKTFCANADNGAWTTKCTTTGTVTFPTLSPGSYDIGTYVDDQTANYLPTHTPKVTVTSGQTSSLAVTMRKAATFTTTIKDAKTGAPVPDACVELVDKTRPTWLGAGPLACADDHGVATLPMLQPMDYNLFVWVQDGTHGMQWVGPSGGVGAQAAAKIVTLTSGKTTTVAAIKLDGAGSITGTVTDKTTGAPIPWAHVGVSSYNDGYGNSGPAASTDLTGNYTLKDLGPYDWTLFERHRDYAAQWSGGGNNRLTAEGVKVKVGLTKTHNIRLRKGSTLAGTIVGADGRPIDGSVRVTVINALSLDEMGSGNTDATGAFTVPVLGPQDIKIKIEGLVDGTPVTAYFKNAADLASAKTVTVPGSSGTKTITITITP